MTMKPNVKSEICFLADFRLSLEAPVWAQEHDPHDLGGCNSQGLAL